MQPPDPILIFANPIAGRGRGQTIARRLEARLASEGYRVTVCTERPDLLQAGDLLADARAAIIIGGDGTLRSVAERLCMTADDAAPSPKTPVATSPTQHSAHSTRHSPPPARAPLAGPPLLVVPLGTANLMGRHLGIEWERHTLEDQVSRAIRRGKVVRLDAARAGGKLFLLMVGVGFDAAVVHELDRIRKGPISFAHYVLPAAVSLAGYQYPSLRVTIDGRVAFPGGPAVAFVGNVAEYGTGFPILTRARPDDGLLDVCVLPCGSPPPHLLGRLHVPQRGDDQPADMERYSERDGQGAGSAWVEGVKGRLRIAEGFTAEADRVGGFHPDGDIARRMLAGMPIATERAPRQNPACAAGPLAEFDRHIYPAGKGASS